MLLNDVSIQCSRFNDVREDPLPPLPRPPPYVIILDYLVSSIHPSHVRLIVWQDWRTSNLSSDFSLTDSGPQNSGRFSCLMHIREKVNDSPVACEPSIYRASTSYKIFRSHMHLHSYHRGTKTALVKSSTCPCRS